MWMRFWIQMEISKEILSDSMLSSLLKYASRHGQYGNEKDGMNDSNKGFGGNDDVEMADTHRYDMKLRMDLLIQILSRGA